MNKKTIQEEKPKKRVAIYIRVSTEDQAERGYGAEDQLAKINQYIKLRDDEFVFVSDKNNDQATMSDEFVFFDTKSGVTDIYARPRFSAMLEYILSEDCPFDTIIVYKLDRLARSLLVLLNIVEVLKQNKISFISTQESIDTTSIIGQAMIGFMGIIAEMERETIRERTRGGRDISRKQKGIRQVAPYGYKKNLERNIEVEPETAPIVKRIFDMFTDEQLQPTAIAIKLKQEFVQTPSNSNKHHSAKKMRNPYLWRDSTIRGILKNKTYIGEYWFTSTNQKKETEEFMSDILNEPLVTKEQFEMAQILLEKKGGYIKPESNYLLGGLLKCDCCKLQRESLAHRVGTTKGTNRYYQCGGKNTAKNSIPCNVVSLQKEALEKLVITKMKEFIINPEKLKIISESNKKRASNASRIVKRKIEIEKQIEVHSNAIERARNLYEGSAYTEKEWLMKDKQARENIKELEAELKKVLKEELKSNDIIKYQKILQYINSMTEESIDNIFKNHENAKTLISYIINEIIVYSRPATEGDKIQGRPKQNGGVQMVPYHIDIKFNTPDVIMADMLKEELGETNGNKEATTNTNKTKLKGKSNSKPPKSRIITQDPEKILQIFGIPKEQVIKEIYNYKKEGGTIIIINIALNIKKTLN